MKVIITNSLKRKTFDLVNILLQYFEIKDLIFTSNSLFNKIRVKIIYRTDKVFMLRDNLFELDLYKISKIFEDEKIIFLPIEESTVLLFYNFISQRGRLNFRFILPNFDKFKLSINKFKLNKFCLSNNIPCPELYSKEYYKFPLIIKPIHGSGSENIKFIFSEKNFNPNRVDFNNFFIQKLLENPKDIHAGFFLCLNGKIINFYSHKRIRTFPERGGVTVFSKSENNLILKSAGKKIIEKLNWSGILMIEFLKDNKTNNYSLIEINPRIWGSIMLSEFNNSKLIKTYIDLCNEEKIINRKIKSDVYIRWVFPYDLLYFFKHPKSFFRSNYITCYINFTYSSFFRSLTFIILTYFNFKKILNIWQKK